MKQGSWRILLITLILPQIAGIIGSVFSVVNVSSWYQTLSKPAFTPPGWIFAPVWITLYVLMGLALFFVVTSDSTKETIRAATVIFCIHLFVNAAWSPLFFGLHSPLLGLIDISVLWLMIAVLAGMFWRIRPVAAMLLVPYWGWVSFASILNYTIWRMN